MSEADAGWYRDAIMYAVDVVIATDHPAVFAHTIQLGPETVIAAHNLSDAPCRVQLDVDASSSQLTELLTAAPATPVSSAPLVIDLAPYGYQWLHLPGATR